MTSVVPQVILSDIDEKRFGVRTAKAHRVTAETLGFILDFCRKNSVIFLIARCDASEMKIVQAMEAEGFFLTDTLLYYKCDLQTRPVSVASQGVSIRPLRTGEAEIVRLLASEAFHGYCGHYHADPRLDRDRCDEVYASWAYRACTSKEVADHVFVAELNCTLVGFAALKMINSEEDELILNAVHPDAQEAGVYSTLVSALKEWCFSRGAHSLIASTHLRNTGAQKTWTRQGFELSNALYTFHKWFD